MVVALFVFLCSRSHAESPIINGPPEVKSDGAALFVAQGEFRASLETARESSLRAAQVQIRDWLAKQSPPVDQTPSIEMLRRDGQMKEYSPEEERILNGSDRAYKITVELTLTPKVIRDLRGRDRAERAVRGIAFLGVSLAGLALLLRVRNWNRARH